MATPLISCLIPVYNAEPYLALALDSIAAQTVHDFDVILVDDGSSDGSAATMAAYAARDPRFKIVTKRNGGIVSALNAGLAHCTGRYVARMDGDDIAMPDRFAVQLEAFRQHPDAVAVGGYFEGIDSAGRSLGVAGLPSRVTRTDLSTFPPQVANVQHSAGTFRRDAYVAVGGYRGTFPHAEDYDLYLRLAPHGRFINPARIVLQYRKHEGSLSVRNLARQELSAALAELSALARRAGRPDPGDSDVAPEIEAYRAVLGEALCPSRTIERYVAFRIHRRLVRLNTELAAATRREVMADLRRPENWRTAKDVALNRRILMSFSRRVARAAQFRLGLSRAPRSGEATAR